MTSSFASTLSDAQQFQGRLRRLSNATHAFAQASRSTPELFETVVRQVAESLQACCTLSLLSEDASQFTTVSAFASQPELHHTLQALVHGQPQPVESHPGIHYVVSTGTALFAPFMERRADVAPGAPEITQLARDLQVQSALVVPLLDGDRVIGTLGVARQGPGSEAFSEDDLTVAQTLAQHAALALASARAFEQTARDMAERELLEARLRASAEAEKAALAAAVEANSALRRSEEEQRHLFDASPMPLLVYDVLTLEPLAVNEAALRLYGYTRRELMQAKVSTLVGQSPEVVRERLLTMPDTQLTGTADYLRQDGTVLTVQYTTRGIVFEGRRARITALNDITGRIEAERTNALLVAIVESANDAILSKRLDGVITSWNGAAERMFGYAAGEAVGKAISLIIPSDRLHEEVEFDLRVTAGERVNSYETIRCRKDGTEIPVSLSLAPVLDNAGNVVGVSKTARDLSAQRAATEALQRIEDQLRQAQKMEAIGRFAGGIAHDFNNSLSVILSYCDLIAGDLEPGHPATADIDEVRKATLSAADLTRQLLVFSRQQVIAPKAVDLNVTVRSMDKMLRRILGEDVDLVSQLATDLGHVLVDPSNIEQVIMNLVVNARDAMPTGGQLTIETANVELDSTYGLLHLGSNPGDYVLLAVSDTGIGMDRQTQARIFEPFFTTKEVGKGTGLGLSTVFGIAQQAGGSVWVYSEPGRGTTFKVYLPRVAAATAVSHVPGPSPAPHGGETVLLAEDQEQVRNVAHGILQRRGYRVLVASSAGEALLLAEAHPGPIELLLTDVVMPHQSGAELAKRLALTRPDTKVLFMSGYTDDSVIRHGVLESGVAFLQKPFTPESLARKVREVLDGR